MKSFVRDICGLFERGETLVLATVVDSIGSTPRAAGAKMAIRRAGGIIGTVGGGLVEAMACKDGRAMLDAGEGAARLMTLELTQELAAKSDMICGGGLTVLLQTMEPGGPAAAAYGELDILLRRGRSATLRTRLEDRDGLRVAAPEVLDGVDAPEEGGPAMEQGVACFEKEDTGGVVLEPFVPPAPLFLFGAGHVSRTTARVAAMAGFRVVVLDDRADYASAERFPEADEVVVLSAFKDCFEGLNIGPDAFVVIVTRGHLHDCTVLGQALETRAKYVGMIGSRKKRDAIYDALRKAGASDGAIARCHCPIGLNIGAQTPEEIAISITGELVAVRAGKQS